MRSVWLSHLVDPSTPLYGGEKSVNIGKLKSIEAGDSCNTTRLCLTSHTGTHVDVPYHFFPSGDCIGHYEPQSWIFNQPRLFDVTVPPGDLICRDDISPRPEPDPRVDFILLRTGSESHRSEDIYWMKSPGIAPALATYFVENYPELRAMGVDFISISSLLHREQGRAVHKIFLENNIMIFEDMALSEVGQRENLEQVIALPLRFEKGDGSPCTIIGWMSGADASLSARE
jgi:kynurenine formamidase